MSEHKSKRGTNDARLQNIMDVMAREINESKELLHIAERNLSSLQSQLSFLQAAYNDALRCEAEEAAAADK